MAIDTRQAAIGVGAGAVGFGFSPVLRRLSNEGIISQDTADRLWGVTVGGAGVGLGLVLADQMGVFDTPTWITTGATGVSFGFALPLILASLQDAVAPDGRLLEAGARTPRLAPA